MRHGATGITPSRSGTLLPPQIAHRAMLENARRQVLLVLLTIAAAIAVVFAIKPSWGPDLKGGVQLVYNVPESAIVDAVGPNTTEDEVMATTVSVIAQRADPHGTIGVLVTRQGKYGILIELPYMQEAELQAAKQRISSLGKLEMRIVATDEYVIGSGDAKQTPFKMADERKRLEDWLKNGGKELVLKDWKAIDNFNSLEAATGGPIAQGKLRWFAHLVEPKTSEQASWDFAFSQGQVDDLRNGSVAVFEPADYNGGAVPSAMQDLPLEKRHLLEYVAINMDETSFTGADLDSSGVGPTYDENGRPAVAYRISGDKEIAYSDWSAKYINKHSAIILNNQVESAPRFISRIPGHGQITGDFTQPEVEELVKVLRTGSLKVEPELRQEVKIGPTLGARAVRLGGISLAAGALAVFAFSLFYYRLAGVVACITLLLNVFLLWAAVVFMHATITLPGLGGIVLTMGMAVDANILIYERIREEQKKGKDLLRATRAGFERAMVVILDANITTFLTGLVLYNVGVGPVRGFAVTLMVGIVTTVFTQFFVTRLLFHFLIEKQKLTEYRMRELLHGARFDFVRWVKPCLTVSALVIVFGLVYAKFVVPPEILLGTDFTGGANLQMVLREPTSVDRVRNALEGDQQFNANFKNPQVNTIGDEPGSANRFNVRIKLNSTMRDRIEREREEWRQLPDAEQQGNQYQPPYVKDLRRIFADQLVQPAFSDSEVVPLPPPAAHASAQIVLHFSKPVDLAAMREQLKPLTAVSVRALGNPEATQTADPFVEWNVPPKTEAATLFSTVNETLGADFKDVDGNKVVLSDPFPEAQEIEGRMVGELRNAAIGALIVSWVLIMLYLRVRFHEYAFGVAAVLALVHDVLVSFAVIVVANHLGLVHAEINLNMIACFLTIIGYSVNDTIVVFDRIRENLAENARLGEREDYRTLINRSINQTLSRTVLTSGVTMFCVLAQLVVNYGSDSDLESFAFAMVVGIVTGTYSSIYIAAPILLMLGKHAPTAPAPTQAEPVKVAGAS